MFADNKKISGYSCKEEFAIDFIPFRYPGQYHDIETGLYYNRFRYFSPDEGIYTQVDPLDWLVKIRRFGDPNTWIDPMGLSQTYWLEKAMRADGRPITPGKTAHHKVPLKSNAKLNGVKYGELSRDLLERHGLNPDIAKNGARLLGTARSQRSLSVHPGRDTARTLGNYHAGKHIHSPQNDKYIYQILRKAEKKGLDVGSVLSDIGRRMEEGSWKNTVKCH
ncbi:RHS repeat-associated core domain-containing protein [Lysinibacillus sp. NPDC056232]|uniref:RHS repeat-associated core domain-containing protein n=1 Tax=Lysinibacillus sp. NPDC056232 TaxID=3345756 RepID=UPI0035DE7995